MTDNRLNIIKKWADELLNTQAPINTQIALGVAVAHIKELVDSIEQANAEKASNDYLNEHIRKTSELIKDEFDNKVNLPYITRPSNIEPLTVSYKSSEENELTTVDYSKYPKAELPADLITDELVESVANDTRTVDQMLSEFAEAENVEQIDASDFYDYSKPTKLETLLAEHFREDNKEKIIATKVSIDYTGINQTISTFSKIEQEQREINLEEEPAHTPQEYAHLSKVYDNLSIEQKLGLKPFEGTMNDINIGAKNKQIEESIKVQLELDRKNRMKEQEKLKQERIADAEDFIKTANLEQSFSSKYGGTIATIDTPFEGTMVEAPGMGEDGYINEADVPYFDMSQEMKKEFRDKLLEQEQENKIQSEYHI